MAIRVKSLPRIILTFVKLMFSKTVDVSRRVLEFYSALSSLKQFELLSCQQDNFKGFSKLIAKIKFRPLFRCGYLQCFSTDPNRHK